MAQTRSDAVIAALRKRLDEERQGSINTMLKGLEHEKYLFSCGFVHALSVFEGAIDEILESLQRS